MGISPTRRIAEANRNLVFNEVRVLQRASVDELVRYTGRSQPTVLKWLNSLEAEGYLSRAGTGRSTGGRPPLLYQFNRERNLVLGLAVEIPDVKVALLDLAGHPVATEGWSIALDANSDQILHDLAERVGRFLAEKGAPGSKVTALGIAFSGFIDQQDGVSLATPRLPAWRNVPVRDFFAERFDLPVVLNHHIDALTIAELCYGSARDLPDFLYFDVGYGLGIRSVKDGRPVHGVFGNAGLIGHTTVVPSGRECLCGNEGCLEEYVSGRVLLRQEITASHGRGQTHDDLMLELAERLFDAWRREDLPSGRIVEEIAEYLAIGLANAINVFDLPRVILSGFVSAGGERFRQQLYERCTSHLQATFAAATELTFSTVPRPSAGAYGAGLFALRQHLPFADPLVVPDQPEGRGVNISALPHFDLTAR